MLLFTMRPLRARAAAEKEKEIKTYDAQRRVFAAAPRVAREHARRHSAATSRPATAAAAAMTATAIVDVESPAAFRTRRHVFLFVCARCLLIIEITCYKRSKARVFNVSGSQQSGDCSRRFRAVIGDKICTLRRFFLPDARRSH